MRRVYSAAMNRPLAGALTLVAFLLLSAHLRADPVNLFSNSDFLTRAGGGLVPAQYQLAGNVQYRYLGDENRDISPWGVALNSAHDGSGYVSQSVTGIDTRLGRWFRFTFRGLPQDHFAVADDDLLMRVEFFGQNGRISYDAKAKAIYPVILQARRDMSVNGDRHVGGAAVWRTYQLDFYIPFPQVDTLRLGVAFGHGSAASDLLSDFFITDFRLVRIPDPPPDPDMLATPTGAIRPQGSLIALGGRWYYEPTSAEPRPPVVFDHTNADRLLYHDAEWSAPFDGNMTAWLRAGDKDSTGEIVEHDQLIQDNVTVSFDTTSMIIHTKGLPNHPTGRFPDVDFGIDGNPNYIQEHNATYYIPLDPKVNPRHIVTAADNSNHALPMGPIGIAVNGVVFFSPFDAGSQDATNLMDRCCGHPAPDGTYHYHKYPVCINSPWADEGRAHSPLIGWAFDGFPIYGPYESDGVMAKDVTGPNALNGFNLHWDKDRGWHYHVTPGRFPYIIGGYWGTEDSRDARRRGPMMGNFPGPGGPGFGPPPGGPGFGPPPNGPPPF